jgi:hypothetical protein
VVSPSQSEVLRNYVLEFEELRKKADLLEERLLNACGTSIGSPNDAPQAGGPKAICPDPAEVVAASQEEELACGGEGASPEGSDAVLPAPSEEVAAVREEKGASAEKEVLPTSEEGVAAIQEGGPSTKKGASTKGSKNGASTKRSTKKREPVIDDTHARGEDCGSHELVGLKMENRTAGYYNTSNGSLYGVHCLVCKGRVGLGSFMPDKVHFCVRGCSNSVGSCGCLYCGGCYQKTKGNARNKRQRIPKKKDGE